MPTVADGALRQALLVAYADKGPPGGTCLSVGCLPSSPCAPILIYEAIDAMVNQGTTGRIAKGLQLHQEPSEVVLRAPYCLRESH